MRRESGVRQDEWQVVGRYWVGMIVGLGLAVVGLGVVTRMRKRSGREVGVAGLIVGTRMGSFHGVRGVWVFDGS